MINFKKYIEQLNKLKIEYEMTKYNSEFFIEYQNKKGNIISASFDSNGNMLCCADLSATD